MNEAPRAVEPPNLNPHARLLQLMDAFSLALCFGGKQEAAMDGIPRRGWDDRVSLALSPLGHKRIAIAPYPFDQDPLTLLIPGRLAARQPYASQTDFLRDYYADQRVIVSYTLQSAA